MGACPAGCASARSASILACRGVSAALAATVTATARPAIRTAVHRSAVLLCTTAIGAENELKNAPPEEGLVVLENELLRVTVSPVGARAVSVFDKVRQREEVKRLPYVGGVNEIRYGAALNLDEGRDR